MNNIRGTNQEGVRPYCAATSQHHIGCIAIRHVSGTPIFQHGFCVVTPHAHHGL